MFRFCSKDAAVGILDELAETSSHTGSTEEVIDLKGDQFKDSPVVENFSVTYRDLWALAVMTAVGGHFLNWNNGLTAGFGSYIIATFLIASGYVSLICCESELSSAIPFAGGAYGIARVTLGIFPGFLVACLDSFKSVLYVATAAGSIGRMISFVTEGDRGLEPVYWLVFYIVAVGLHSYGGRTLWRCINGLAVTSVLLLVMYVLGSIKYANLAENSPLKGEEANNSPYEQWFHGGMYEFMHVLPTPCWFFVGIQSINVACGEMLNPKSDIPKSYMAAMMTTLLTSFSVLLIACSLSPGVPSLMTRLHPMTRGYMKMFALTLPQATVISLPATIATGFGFMYFVGQQLRAMGMSGMLNPLCSRVMPGRNTPVGALVLSSVLGYALCLLIFFRPGIRRFTYNISMLCASSTYLSIFVSFLIFRKYYSKVTREFVSPLGLAGAVYGFVVFFLVFMSLCGFQKTPVTVITFVTLSALCIAYYYAVVQKRQVFSEEEKKVMFKAYLVKGNAAKANRIRKGAGGSNGSVSAGYSSHGNSGEQGHGRDRGERNSGGSVSNSVGGSGLRSFRSHAHHAPASGAVDPQSEVQLTLLTGASSGISEGSATVLEEGAALVMSEGAVQEGDNASLLRKELQAGEDEGTEVIERELALKQVHELEDMFDQSPRRRGDSAWWEAGEGGDLEAGPPTSAVK